MPKPKILLQLDGDRQASVFDSVVAVDAGIDHLLRHGGVKPADVRSLVHGALFTRGLDELRRTAVFIGGGNVSEGEQLLASCVESFFGPFRVSVLLDANGANTTAAAAVLSAAAHLDLKEATALVLGGTGPVGQRVVRLLAGEGAAVRVGSRAAERAAEVCASVRKRVPNARLEPVGTPDAEQTAAALEGVSLVVAAGASGVELLSVEARRGSSALKVAVDLNAVPPLGLGGVEATDRAKEREGVTCYGALGVGGLKMKIHKAALRRLFKTNDLVLDAEEVFALGRELVG
jgi:hypothetical protein